jgi:Winged helix DNA-binding domain
VRAGLSWPRTSSRIASGQPLPLSRLNLKSARGGYDGAPLAAAVVSLRQLNRWTLARQMLLERVELDAVSAIERLAGMQAQHPPSPYIGLWSRVRGFRRDELEAAVLDSRVIKATLMRGTLHLVSERDYDRFRAACRDGSHPWRAGSERLHELGYDVDALRARILAALAERPLSRVELDRAFRHEVPADLPDWLAFSTVWARGDVVNVPGDARFGHPGGSHYRPAPPRVADPATGLAHVVAAYLRAFGPATRADLAQWLGRPVARFREALEALGTVTFQAEDGRALLDLPDAPRPDAGTPAPVRFLPRWDNLLLSHARRERVLPEPLRKTVIAKNGDVLPTFLVDGVVAGAWSARPRGPAVMTLTPFGPIPARQRRAVAAEAEELLAWLRPDTRPRDVRWTAY